MSGHGKNEACAAHVRQIKQLESEIKDLWSANELLRTIAHTLIDERARPRPAAAPACHYLDEESLDQGTPSPDENGNPWMGSQPGRRETDHRF